jgi:hypothetical protein
MNIYISRDGQQFGLYNEDDAFGKSPTDRPLVASQSLPVLSSEAVTIHRPSGLNCADFTTPSCFMGPPTGLPVATSQNRAV